MSGTDADEDAGTGARRPSTLCAQALHAIDPASGGVVPPIQPSTTFARDPDYRLLNPDHSYARDEAPGYRPVEALLCALEEGRDALLFASGMAAIAAPFRTLGAGEPVLAQRSIYHGTSVWLERFCARRQIPLHRFEAREPASLERLCAEVRPALVWVETPSNPMLDVVDIAHAAGVAHAAGAMLAVDGTLATPILSRPLALGADIVCHSASKALNGHSDVLAGVLVTRAEDERWRQIRQGRHEDGAVLGSFEAWLLLRGLRTLALRIREASANALAVATFLQAQPRVSQVLYPGLPDHPGHAIAARQMAGGFGGLLSFRVKGGAAAALEVAGRLRLIVRATSLGGVESLIEHRHSIEPASTGVPPDLLRLSVGIEDPGDLIADLEQALGP